MINVTLNNGVEMPALGLGVFQSSPEDTIKAVQAALDTGVRSGPDPSEATWASYGSMVIPEA